MSRTNAFSRGGRCHRDVEHDLRESAYVPLAELPGWDGETPYPILMLNDRFDVHIIPFLGYLNVWIADSTTDMVQAKTRVEAGEMFRDDGPASLIDAIQTRWNYDAINIREEDFDRLEEQAAAKFADPFDPVLREQLRPPLSTWLKRQLIGVKVSEGEQPGSAEWEITYWVGGSEQTLAYSTADVVCRFPTSFKRDFTKRFREYIPLGCSQWNVWFEVSMDWIRNAVSHDSTEPALAPGLPSSYELAESSTSTIHLRRDQHADAVCGRQTASDGREWELDLNDLPATPALCAHCSERVKQLMVEQRLNTSTLPS